MYVDKQCKRKKELNHHRKVLPLVQMNDHIISKKCEFVNKSSVPNPKHGSKVKKNSQIKEIIAHLRKYKTITSNEAIKKYGASRLSGIIFVLKKRGFIIKTEMVCGKNRYGNMSPYAVYHLEKDIEVEDSE